MAEANIFSAPSRHPLPAGARMPKAAPRNFGGAGMGALPAIAGCHATKGFALDIPPSGPIKGRPYLGPEGLLHNEIAFAHRASTQWMRTIIRLHSLGQGFSETEPRQAVAK